MLEDLRVLRNYPGFTKLVSARLISNFGNGFMPIALSFGILALPGGSASDVSLVLGVQLAPTIAFMVFGGVAGKQGQVKAQADHGGTGAPGGGACHVSTGVFPGARRRGGRGRAGAGRVGARAGGGWRGVRRRHRGPSRR